MTSHVSFLPVIRRIFSRQLIFPRVKPRLGITTSFVFVAFFSLFLYGSGETLGQTYSADKNAWKTTRPKIEPGATRASDVASKRASVLLPSTNKDALSSQTKTRSKSNASSLKTYRPNVSASSSSISPSSFSEKKVELNRPSDKISRSLNKNQIEQDEAADKEKLFAELERRSHINLLDDASKGAPGLASFEFVEPEIDEAETLEKSFPEIIPFPSDSESSLSVSLDEEVEGVQNTRQNSFVSGLELYGSAPIVNEDEEEGTSDAEIQAFDSPDEDDVKEVEISDVQNADVVEEIKNSIPQNENDVIEVEISDSPAEQEVETPDSQNVLVQIENEKSDSQTDAPQKALETSNSLNDEGAREIETLKQIAETLKQLDAESETQAEDLATLTSDVEIPAPKVDLSEMDFEAPILDVDELELDGLDDVMSEAKVEASLSTETENQIDSESDADVTESNVDENASDETLVLPENINLEAFDKEEKEDSKSEEETSLKETNAKEKDSTSKEESTSEESDVPKTASLQTAPSKPIRYTIPRRSILSFDDEEEEEETEETEKVKEPTSVSVKSVEKITQQRTEDVSDVSSDSSPKTFAEEADEIEEEVDVEEVSQSDAQKFVETSEPSNESADVEEEEEKELAITEISNEEQETTQDSPELEVVAVSSESTGSESQTKTDDRFFSKFRVLQRGRQRRLFNGRLLEAPTPPSIDDLDPEVAKQTTEPPLLTKENANLPSLDVEGTYKANKPALAEKDAEELREEMKKFSWTKGAFTITPYGFLNLSVAADTQRSTPGEFILYVQSPEVDDSSGFSVDARTSRLGLDIAGPRVEALSATLGGKVEFDFQGSVNGSKNKGGLQLRRAYVELVDKQHDRKFLAGQDWEIISPVAPQMLNYLPLGFVGDMQYRRGMVRFDQGWTWSPDLHVLGQVAVCDDVIGDYTSTSGVSGATAGWPVLEARLAGSFFGNVRDGLPITLGISGHIGEQNYKFSALAGVPSASTAVKRPIKTWSANFDLDAPITRTQKIQGEVFTGSNLSTFCGGINQGIDLIRREGIRSSGGWLAWHSDCTEKMDVNFGYGIDKPNEKDLVGTSSPSNGYTTARTQNQVYFVNCIYNWTPNFMTGLETSYWQTDYQKAYVASEQPIFYDMESGKSTRIEFVTRLSF